MDSDIYLRVNIDAIIVALFLLATIVVAITHGKTVKTIEDYALGGRNFHTGVLVATIVATWVSGSMFFSVLSNTYKDGISFFLAVLALVFSFMISAYIFIPRMTEFLGKISIAHVISDIYGNNVRFIVAVAGIIGSAGSIAIQFKVFGTLYSHVFGIPPTEAVIIAGIIVTIYSTFGGIKAVTYTDLIQFIAFSWCIPLVGVMLWSKISGTDFSLSSAFLDPKFNYKEVFSLGNPNFLEVIALCLYFAIPHLKPQWFQRVSMSKDIAQAKKAFIIASFVMLIITVAIAWIPFLLFNLDPNLDTDDLFGFIINNYAMMGFKGILVVIITSMAMSTADSYLNASAVLFANDIYEPITKNKKRVFNVSRLVSLILGLASIAISFTSKDLLKIILFTNSFYVPIITPILMVTILGFRTSLKSVYIAMISSFIMVIYWKIAEIKIDVIAIAMVVNLLFLFGTHYLFRQKGGWTHYQKIESTFWPDMKRKFEEFNFMKFYTKYSPNNELSYMGFGIYLIICTISTMYSTQTELLSADSKIVLEFYQLMLVTGVMLAMYPIWPLRIKKIEAVKIAWPILIWINLVFLSSIFLIASNFGHLQFVIFTANTILIIVLAGWKMSMLLISSGFYSSLWFYKNYMRSYNFGLTGDNFEFILVFSFVVIGAVIAIFLKPRQIHMEYTEERVVYLDNELDRLSKKVSNLSNDVSNKENVIIDLTDKIGYYISRISLLEREMVRLDGTANRILTSLDRKMRNPMIAVVNYSELLLRNFKRYSESELELATNKIFENSKNICDMILSMLDVAALKVKEVKLREGYYSLRGIIFYAIDTCKALYIKDDRIKIDFEFDSESTNGETWLDRDYMIQTVTNLLINAIQFSTTDLIRVTLSNNYHCLTLTVTNEGEEIPAEDLPHIFSPFISGSNTDPKENRRGLGLTLCKTAVEAHQGQISVESKDGKTIFKVILPLHKWYFENV